MQPPRQWQLRAGERAATYARHMQQPQPASNTKITSFSHRFHVFHHATTPSTTTPLVTKKPPRHAQQPAMRAVLKHRDPSQHQRNTPNKLFTTALTDACSTPHKTCSVKPVRVSEPTQGPAHIWHTRSAVRSSRRGTAALAGATCRHNTPPPKPRTHNLLLTTVLCSWRTTRPAAPRPARLHPLPRWAATPALLCAACQPLAR